MVLDGDGWRRRLLEVEQRLVHADQAVSPDSDATCLAGPDRLLDSACSRRSGTLTRCVSVLMTMICLVVGGVLGRGRLNWVVRPVVAEGRR